MRDYFLNYICPLSINYIIIVNGCTHQIISIYH